MTTTVLYGPPKVGGDILAFCTKCRMELAHVVVSMIDTKPARVMCKTCKGQHNYKRLSAMPLARGSSSGTRKAAAPRVSLRASEYWEQKMAEAANAAVSSYSPKSMFKQGEVIKHAHFGMGLVQEVKLGGKIVVIFREGEKILVHGIGQPATA